MPELPEVEHVVRALRRAIVGRRIVATEIRLPKLVAPTSPFAFNRKIKSSTITGVSRRGKFILIELNETDALPDHPTTARLPRRGPRGRASDTSGGGMCQKPARKQGLVLAVHLRMTGKFLYLNADDVLPKHAHAIFYFDNDRRLVFRDQRKFGVMRLVARTRLAETKGISQLAPEPFSDDFNVGYLKDTLARSRRTLKTLLLDQTKVLGLGNIYAAEALFRARINPFKISSELSMKRVARLHAEILEVLRDAISDSSTSRIDLEQPDGVLYGEAFERFC